jgi:hypothetical protein
MPGTGPVKAIKEDNFHFYFGINVLDPKDLCKRFAIYMHEQ